MNITMHVPPECCGQMVEYAYGSDGEAAYRRITDSSDRRVTWSKIDWSDAWAAVDDGTEIEPA